MVELLSGFGNNCGDYRFLDNSCDGTSFRWFSVVATVVAISAGSRWRRHRARVVMIRRRRLLVYSWKNAPSVDCATRLKSSVEVRLQS